ncbi:alpha/beta fold hydrolase [bacterium]|nr:alpha/beta fold hydrolase [bacterium]
MRVSSQLPPQAPPVPNRPAPPPNSDNPLEADSFVFDFPSNYPAPPAELYELPKDEAPRLNRPVLLVHGFNGDPGNWLNMRTWLTRSGENKDGGVIQANANIDPQGKVFTMQFARPFNPVSNNSAELRQAINNITAATGSSEIDVVAHSMGGLDTRLYLDQGDEKVDKLVMIATPNHGSVLADIELTFRELGIPIMPSTDDPLVRQALTDCSEERGDNNPLLAQLNKNWARQKSRAEIFVITGNGRPTLANRFTLTLRGDGVVPQKSAHMDGVPQRNVWWTNHSGVKEHPDALLMTGAFLTGRALPVQQDEPPDVPAAKEIVPQQINADKDQLNYVIKQ